MTRKGFPSYLISRLNVKGLIEITISARWEQGIRSYLLGLQCKMLQLNPFIQFLSLCLKEQNSNTISHFPEPNLLHRKAGLASGCISLIEWRTRIQNSEVLVT